MTERFETRVAVFVIVRNETGDVLLQQRAPDSYLGGHWDFPSGHGENGEDLRVSAVRELKEEVGLDGRVEDLQLVHIDQYFLEVNYINFVFALDTWQGTPRVCEPDKCSAVQWFAENNLPQDCVNVVRAVVAHDGWSNELTYSVTDEASFAQLMGRPFSAYQKNT